MSLDLECRFDAIEVRYQIFSEISDHEGCIAWCKDALARIRELESACYRLTEERDRLKGWSDKYHDEVLELRRQIEERE